jgi:hypothetical protein
MAEKKEKSNPVAEFRAKIAGKSDLATLSEGIKSTNAKVRALSAKLIIRLGDKSAIKTLVMPLAKTDKTKKVLRAIDKKVKRKELRTKVEGMLVKKAAGGKAKAPAEEKPAGA